MPGHEARDRTFLKETEHGTSVVLAVASWDPDAEGLSAIGGRFIAFGRFGVTWRALGDLHLTVQVDAHSSPYGAPSLSPLSDAAIMLGLGGTWVLGERMSLDVAVTEDDGTGHSAPDIGLHAALRWRH